MNRKWIFLIWFFLVNSFALDVDEKITMRILSLSSTKKTALVNRGLEDGLVVGDHAKFFLTTGVVARAVVIKASPTRSVWSIYRFINKNVVEVDRVMSLKITTPVRITEDESKSIKYQAQQVDIDEGNIALEERSIGGGHSEDLNKLEGHSENAPERVATIRSGHFWNRTFEIWAGVNYQSLSGTSETTSNSTVQTSYAIQFTTLDVTAGLEKYFPNSNSWIESFSIGGIFRYAASGSPIVSSNSTFNIAGDWMDFGLSIAWHFGNSPFAYHKMIGYVPFSIGLGGGSTEDTSQSVAAGTSTFYSLGIGFKYYIFSGFGMRALVNYFARTETYPYDNFDDIRSISGPRFEVAFSYRW